MKKKATNYLQQMLEHSKVDKRTGIPHLDAGIADYMDQSRRPLPYEMEELLKAKVDPSGSRMISPKELSKLDARKQALSRMKSRSIKEVGEEAVEGIGSKIGKKLLRGGLGKAAGLAIAGPLALFSEGADADELNMPPKGSKDEIIESTDHSPEQKQKLLRGMEAMEKARRPDFFDDVNKVREQVQRTVDSKDTRSQEELEEEARVRQYKMDILAGRRFK